MTLARIKEQLQNIDNVVRSEASRQTKGLAEPLRMHHFTSFLRLFKGYIAEEEARQQLNKPKPVYNSFIQGNPMNIPFEVAETIVMAHRLKETHGLIKESLIRFVNQCITSSSLERRNKCSSILNTCTTSSDIIKELMCPPLNISPLQLLQHLTEGN